MKTLKTRLKEGIKEGYLLFGEDYYLYDRAFSMIKSAANVELEEFNILNFDDENFSARSVCDACEVMPMGSDRKLVVLKNIEKISEADKKLLLEYTKDIPPFCTLVIFDFAGKFDFLKENLEPVDCKRFDKPTAIAVLASEFAKRGKQISSEAADTLYEHCNGYLTRAMCEVDKLAYYDLSEPLVTKKQVENLVTKDNEYVVFELTEALGARNGDKALKLLDAMIKEPGVLGLITNHFRRLFFISISDLDEKALATLLGVKEFAIKKQRSQIKNFSKMQLKKIYSLLEKVDYSIKSGAMLQETALYFLVLNILYI